MSWYDPCVARWVDAVVLAVKAVHRGALAALELATRESPLRKVNP